MLKGFRSEKTNINHQKITIHSSLPIPFLQGVKRFSKKTSSAGVRGGGDISLNVKNLGESFSWQAWVKKCLNSIFWLTNGFSSNLNTINLKNFPNHSEMYSFERKLTKYGEKKSPKHSKEIWKYVSLTYLRGGNWYYVHSPFCWSWPGG